MNFRVGQKVVCISNYMRWRTRLQWILWPARSGLPAIGAVYTITNIYRDEDVAYIELVELPAPAERGWLPGFRASCFRAAVEHKTDISVFTAMLKRRREKVH